MSSVIIEPEKKLAVYGEYDVLVCGGGVAGIAAALAAARQGAKVLLLEREYMLGGLATLGLVTIYLPLCDGMGHQVSFGITDELLRLSIARGIIDGHYPKPWLEGGTIEERAATRFEVQYNPHIFACDAEKLLIDSGVEILYGTLCASVICDEVDNETKRISSVIIENKSGRGAVIAKNVVDTTGDADICKLAGIPTALHKKGNVLAAWYYRYSRDNGVSLKMLGFADVPSDQKKSEAQQLIKRRFGGVDAREISDMVILAHQASLGDAFKQREIDNSTVPIIYPTIPQLRMTRRIVGISTPDDSPTHEYVPTSVGLFSDWRKHGPVYELPYECLVSASCANLITAGRNISVTDNMWDITRVIPVCAVSGEAAGRAAAMFTDDLRAPDIAKLQSALRDSGVKLHCSDVM